MSISAAQVEADVADILYVEPGELDHEADLRDQGMDSVRIMEVVERWRRAGVHKVDFIVLAEDQRLVRWLEVVQRLQEQ